MLFRLARLLSVFVVLSGFLFAGNAAAGPLDLKLGATTTTENSGLLAQLVPRFEAATGFRVRVIVRGTGEVLAAARRGDLDVVLTHDPAAEEKFIAEGFAAERHAVMTNDFVIVGPAADPAGIRGNESPAVALARIAKTGAGFVSRGDDSGTHRAEMRLWQAAGVDPRPYSGQWYFEAGAGMGAVLNIAVGKDLYALSDSGTWGAFGNRRGLVVLVAGAPPVVNRYSVLTVSRERHRHVNAAGARLFAAWITSPQGQAAIAGYKIGGKQLFRPIGRP